MARHPFSSCKKFPHKDDHTNNNRQPMSLRPVKPVVYASVAHRYLTFVKCVSLAFKFVISVSPISKEFSKIFEIFEFENQNKTLSNQHGHKTRSRSPLASQASGPSRAGLFPLPDRRYVPPPPSSSLALSCSIGRNGPCCGQLCIEVHASWRGRKKKALYFPLYSHLLHPPLAIFVPSTLDIYFCYFSVRQLQLCSEYAHEGDIAYAGGGGGDVRPRTWRRWNA